VPIYLSALFLYLVMDFPSLIRDICKILFPVPYHSFHVTGNVFQTILNIVFDKVTGENVFTTS
jgi:hypothetical protein